MKKSEIIRKILGERWQIMPRNHGKAFAPSNIALCKYWGKRNEELNLPVTSSLSISLADKGAATDLSLHDGEWDAVTVNQIVLSRESGFYKRLVEFLNLFRVNPAWRFQIKVISTVPIAAGLASSACGFAALVLALNDLFAWELSHRELSILARLGSGSASRSLWHGFVEWDAGSAEDGMDSHAHLLPVQWPELRIGLLILDEQSKTISSRAAMQRTVKTSALYPAWPNKVAKDLEVLKKAIYEQDFSLLGPTAESNALTMHATMLSAWPPVIYSLPETISTMQKIWDLRDKGLDLYFTQDAGPNLKLLFLANDTAAVKKQFASVEIVTPFN